MFGGLLENRFGPIGLDLGSHHIRMMQLEQSHAGWRVVACAAQQLPADLPQGPARNELLAPILRATFNAGKFRGRKVISCLPSTSVQYKSIRLPKMPPDELKAAVEWEANDRLRLNGLQIQLQYFDAGDVRQGEEVRREVIVLAASSSSVQEHLDLLQMCKLEPLAIDAAPGAMARAFAMPDNGEESASTMIVDVGYSSTKVLILRGNQPTFFKLIDLGGRRFDQLAAQHLQITIPEATELRRSLSGRSTNFEKSASTLAAADTTVKTEEGNQAPAATDANTSENPAENMVSNPDKIARAIFDAVRPTVAELGREIALCLRYYSVTFRGRKPDVIQLTGGESQTPDLAALMTQEAGIEVKPARPLGGFDLSHCTLNPELPHSEWAVAAGLATRKINSKRQRGAA